MDCALCSGTVPRRDLVTRRALRFEGSVYGACCRSQIEDLVPAWRPARLHVGAFVGLVGLVVVALGRGTAAPRFSGMGVYHADEAGLRRALVKGYTELMRPPNTSHVHPISEGNIRWTSVRRLATGD